MENQNVIFWTGEKDPKFSFEKETIEIEGQKDSFDFSVVVAVYNAESFIEETVNSIINQDFGFSKIQLILVDDGAKDSSFEICKKYAERYPENIVLVHKENGGVSSARNVGMRFARGKYINFLDSDDMFSPDSFSKVFSFFEKNEKSTDVVTVKVELFGAKKGDTWFNKKFSGGDRVINLWKEPQIYLNSVNNSFFHSRIKNQLVFDEQLCISEDLKLVNSVLMNKWTLGVLASAKYLYRILPSQISSLSNSARLKENWYFTYLERVYMWLYKKALAQTSCFPKYLQYTLYRDLFNRFNGNKECAQIFDEEQIKLYKEKLFEALSLIDDDVIRGIDVINTDFQVYFFTKKYGAPEIAVDKGAVNFVWKNGEIKVSKRLCVMYDTCFVKDKVLTLEGYLIINNIGIHYDNNLRLSVAGSDVKNIIWYNNTSNDKLAFADEYIFVRKYFKAEIEVKSRELSKIEFFFEANGKSIPFSYGNNCKWFGVSAKAPCSYYYEGGVLLGFEDRTLTVKLSSSFEKRRCEHRLLRYLRKAGKTNRECMKGYKVRKLHNILRLFKLRPLWIVSDRRISAGDNGEAFYKYLKKKPFVNAYFAIEKSCPDYSRLKKLGFKILQPGSKKFKVKYLISDAIVSAHFEDDQLMPISNQYLPDIIQKKKHVFLQHGITKDDVSAVYSRKNRKFDMFVTAATPEYKSIIETDAYFCDSSVAKLTGFPRYDYLYNNPRKIVLVIPTWRRSALDRMDHETGNWIVKENFEDTYYFRFYSGLLSNERLKAALAEAGYELVYFPHSNMIPTNEYFKKLGSVKIVEGDDRNYTRLFAESDIMVTDYSSTAFDFAYLRKPIVYCQGDRAEFFGSHTYTEGYFDYERDGFGEVVADVESAVDSIIALLEGGVRMKEEYLARINAFFPYNDKKNCERVYKEIKEL